MMFARLRLWWRRPAADAWLNAVEAQMAKEYPRQDVYMTPAEDGGLTSVQRQLVHYRCEMVDQLANERYAFYASTMNLGEAVRRAILLCRKRDTPGSVYHLLYAEMDEARRRQAVPV